MKRTLGLSMVAMFLAVFLEQRVDSAGTSANRTIMVAPVMSEGAMKEVERIANGTGKNNTLLNWIVKNGGVVLPNNTVAKYKVKVSAKTGETAQGSSEFKLMKMPNATEMKENKPNAGTVVASNAVQAEVEVAKTAAAKGSESNSGKIIIVGTDDAGGQTVISTVNGPNKTNIPAAAKPDPSTTPSGDETAVLQIPPRFDPCCKFGTFNMRTLRCTCDVGWTGVQCDQGKGNETVISRRCVHGGKPPPDVKVDADCEAGLSCLPDRLRCALLPCDYSLGWCLPEHTVSEILRQWFTAIKQCDLNFL